MKKVTRFVEVPKGPRRKELRELYPDFQVIGDDYGWYWPAEKTKTVVVSYGFPTLIEAIKKHLTANDIPIRAELEREIHEFCCEKVPESCEELDEKSGEKIRAWYLAKKFYTAIASVAKDGWVEQSEAERRAQICASCVNNTTSSAAVCLGCWTARFVKEASEALSNRHTSLDNKLDTCGLCQCGLKMKVHVPVSGMQDKDIDWPSFCWMRPEN